MTVFSLLLACKSDLEQGMDSLHGHWEIDEITSFYPKGDVNGESRVAQLTGSLGYFSFSNAELIYDYTRNDTLYQDTTSWKLTTKKVNSGFTKARVFTLTLANGLTYECRFEDQTKNSEKKAKDITLSTTSLVDFNGESSLEIHLVRN